MSIEAFYNITQAATATGLTPPTIRKYLRAGKLPNAVETSSGKVKKVSIPHFDLVAAGLMDKVSGGSETPNGSQSPLDKATALGERIGRMEAENEQLKQRVSELLARALFSEGLWQKELETKQAQAKRRRFWQRSEPKTKQAVWTPEQD